MERNIKLLTIFNFCIELVFYAPVAIIYFSHVTGSYALGMSVFSTTRLSSAFFEVPTGIFSDMIGRKNTLVLGAISSVVSVVFYAIGGSLTILLTGALLEGLGRSFYSGNNDALLHDVLFESKRTPEFHAFLGKLTAYESIGSGVVALIGGVIANWSLSLVMWLSVIPKLINVLISFKISEPKVHSQASGNVFAHMKESIKEFYTNPKLRLLSLASTIRYGVGEANFLFRPAFSALLWPVWALGISNSLSFFGAAFGYSISGKVINKLGAKKVLWIEITVNRVISFIGYGFPTLISPAILGGTSFFYAPAQVALDTLMQKEFTQHQRATMGSLNSLTGSLLFGLAAIVLGMAADKIGVGKTLVLSQFIFLIPLGVYYKIYKKET